MTTTDDRAARDRLANEARQTATVLLDWVGTRVESARTDGAERPRQSAGPCTWCPVCALVAALRGEQPELTAGLAEQASGLLVLLRLLVQSHATGSHDHHTAPPAASEAAADTPPSPEPPGWPAEWGAPSWQTEVPWDVAPHAMFDPTPAPPRAAAATEDASIDDAPRPDDPRPVPERPTGRRGPRPSPRWTPGPTTGEADPVPNPPEPAVANGTGPVVGNGTRANGTGPAVGNGTGNPTGHGTRGGTGPTVRERDTAAERARRGVQRIPVRRRPRPC